MAGEEWDKGGGGGQDLGCPAVGGRVSRDCLMPGAQGIPGEGTG